MRYVSHRRPDISTPSSGDGDWNQSSDSLSETQEAGKQLGSFNLDPNQGWLLMYWCFLCLPEVGDDDDDDEVGKDANGDGNHNNDDDAHEDDCDWQWQWQWGSVSATGEIKKCQSEPHNQKLSTTSIILTLHKYNIKTA